MKTNPATTTHTDAIANPAEKGRAARSARTKREMRNLIQRGRIWYFKKMMRGAVAYVSLETEELELAKAKRDQRLKQASRDELDQIKGPRSARVATIGELLAEYRKVATVADRIEPGTVQANAVALKNVLRWSRGAAGVRDAADVEKLSADILTDELVAKFKVNYIAQAGEDRMAKERRRRGAASWLRQARSVFSVPAMLLYKDLLLPDLKNFLRSARIDFEQRVHLPIDNGMLAAMDQGMLTLATGDEAARALWLVHALHKFAGLRNDEIAQVRPEWFCRAPWGQVFLSIVTRPYFEPKASEGHVPIATAVAQLLAPFVTGPGGQPLAPQDFLVLPRGTKSDRAELIYRTHAEWMRQFLPADKYTKAGYELRRWAAQVMETRYGSEAAEAFLRHAPKTVAERHYFERWYPWRRAGNDVGVTLEDARGVKEDQIANIWVQGADALSGLGEKVDKNAGSNA